MRSWPNCGNSDPGSSRGVPCVRFRRVFSRERARSAPGFNPRRAMHRGLLQALGMRIPPFEALPDVHSAGDEAWPPDSHSFRYLAARDLLCPRAKASAKPPAFIGNPDFNCASGPAAGLPATLLLESVRVSRHRIKSAAGAGGRLREQATCVAKDRRSAHEMICFP